MTLPFANCVLGKWVFALGLFSVQQLCWFLGGIKLCIFLSGLWRKPCPVPHLWAAVMGLLPDLGTVLTLGLPTCCASPPLLCSALKVVPGEMCLLFFLLSGELLWPDVQMVGREKLVAFLCSICTFERTSLNAVHSRYDLWEFNSKNFRKAKIHCPKFTNLSCRSSNKT